MKNNQKEVAMINSFMNQFEINEKDTEKVKEEKTKAFNDFVGIDQDYGATLIIEETTKELRKRYRLSSLDELVRERYEVRKEKKRLDYKRKKMLRKIGILRRELTELVEQDDEVLRKLEPVKRKLILLKSNIQKKRER